MATLSIRDFACFTEARVELGELTIIVGPPASGKSLIARLLYYFAQFPELALSSAEQGHTVVEFRRRIETLFTDYFPPSAWGRGKFRISFEYGRHKLQVIRRMRRAGQVSESVRFSMTDALTNTYREVRARFESQPRETTDNLYYSLYAQERFRSGIRKSLQRFQTIMRYKTVSFIPAGRSFFTSMGKAVTAFDSGGLLDDITLEFGRRFMALRGQRFHLLRMLTRHFPYPSSKVSIEKQKTQAAVLSRLVAGDFFKEGEQEYFITSDGRKIPFANLSSGQQELYPLLAVVSLDVHEQITQTPAPARLMIVEEPEAHLFPSFQSKLVEFISSSMSMTKGKLNFVITTHSPYVLAKINNLLKADEVWSKRDKSKKEKVEKFLDRSVHLKRSSLRAYSLRGGKAEDIVTKDGFIKADYIDAISEGISEEFEQLLGIQYGDA